MSFLVVRVNIEIKYGDRLVRTSAIVNSGYEAEEPEIHIPIKLAEELRIDLRGLSSDRYRVVGAEVSAYRLPKVDVRVVTEDVITEWVSCVAVSVSGEYEVIISDSLMEALGIVIRRAKTGIWSFIGEDRERISSKPQYWI